MTYCANVWQYRSPARPDELKHYASPYYDPVKAHEYYMRTRVLKGRRRATYGLNEEGQRQAADTREQLTKEKEKHFDSLQRRSNNEAASSKAAIQREIATLRAKYMGMSKEERAKNKLGTQREIERLRRLLRRERKRISTQLGLDISKTGMEYNDRYYDTVDKLRDSSAMSSKSKQTSTQKTTAKNTETPRIYGGGGKRTLMTK